MRKELIHLSVSVLVALTALGSYAFWISLLNDARQEAQAAILEVKAIEAENAAISKAEGALSALSADEAAVAAYQVAPEDIVGFLEGLESIGEALRAPVEVVSVSSIGDDGRIDIALRIRGTFSAVMRTLGALEYGPRDLRTKQLILDTVSGEQGSVWTAAMTISAATLTTP